MQTTNNSRGHILVVDDDPTVTTLFGMALRKAGYDVTAAANADEAIAAVSAVRPDLAALDVQLPGTSGLELGVTLRDEFGVPFIFLSGLQDEATVREATAAGAIAYVVKPLDLTQCVPTVEAAYSRAQELRRLRQHESQLETALRQGREISIAIGLLMERLRVNRDAAFQSLRDESRARRRKMAEVAEELLQCAERLNSITTNAAQRTPR